MTWKTLIAKLERVVDEMEQEIRLGDDGIDVEDWRDTIIEVIDEARQLVKG